MIDRRQYNGWLKHDFSWKVDNWKKFGNSNQFYSYITHNCDYKITMRRYQNHLVKQFNGELWTI